MTVYVVYPFKSGKSTEKFEAKCLEDLKSISAEDDCLRIEADTLKKEVYLHFSALIREIFSSHWEEFSSNLENCPGDGHWFDDQFKTEILAYKIKQAFEEERNFILALKGTYSLDTVVAMAADVVSEIAGYPNYCRTDEASVLAYKLVKDLGLTNRLTEQRERLRRDTTRSFGRFN